MIIIGGIDMTNPKDAEKFNKLNQLAMSLGQSFEAKGGRVFIGKVEYDFATLKPKAA